jgi:hypothetical protein
VDSQKYIFDQKEEVCGKIVREQPHFTLTREKSSGIAEISGF